MSWGEALPELIGPVPGPISRSLAQRLARVESRNVTQITEDTPIFWSLARGANVRDVDGNVFVDLTSGFGVAFAGHSNPRVTQALAFQAGALTHALGDVHPADIKVRLLERLAELAPGDLGVSILASTGAEAVEAALKTAALATGRPGVLAFGGAYHGLTYGALATVGHEPFREPFESQLFHGVQFALFPDSDALLATALEAVHAALERAESSAFPIGAILVEPIQGRGGLREPADGFLAALRVLCDGRERVLIFDEVYTGIGRTGRWFACEHWDIVPDLLVVGKALGGGVPISATIGTPAVMQAWPPSSGEAIHTSTFLGNPAACAAALEQLREIESGNLIARANQLGARIRARIDRWLETVPVVCAARGRGLMQGVLLEPRGKTASALAAARGALREGVIVLAEGPRLDVLAITPPAVTTEAQLDHALDVLERALVALR